MEIIIRDERPEDYPEVRRVVKAAFEKEFGRDRESSMIERLRLNPLFVPGLSLVAVADGRVAGYILFFPVTVKSIFNKASSSLCLAPLAVEPDLQRMGIGSRLVEEGLSRARSLGYGSVIVLGHGSYYSRFGFRPAGLWGIRPPFKVPDGAFQAIELREGGLKGVKGKVVYPEEFNEPPEG